MGQNLLTQNFLQHDPLNYHLKSFHRSLNVRHKIHPDLDLSIGLAPDFESLGPYQIVGLCLLSGASTL